jgi:hypothetical protein
MSNERVNTQFPKWVWWKKGECVLEVLSAGHFPTTVMAMTPLDQKIEVEINELELTDVR